MRHANILCGLYIQYRRPFSLNKQQAISQKPYTSFNNNNNFTTLLS